MAQRAEAETAVVLVTRAEKVQRIEELKTLGYTGKQIAEKLGLSLSGVRTLQYDPDGSKQKARRERYRKPCPLCGVRMDGSNGYAGQPRYCLDCTRRLTTKPLIHGTVLAYNTKGCRCQECRAAAAARMRHLYKTNPRVRAAFKRSYQRQTPEQTRAYNAVARAVRRGELIVPSHCEKCGCKDPRSYNGRKRTIHAHHEDYSRPLDVKFLCAACHAALRLDAVHSSR